MAGHESILRTALFRAADRRRRRHGRARHERGRASPLPRRGEPPRPESVLSLHLGFIRAGADLSRPIPSGRTATSSAPITSRTTSSGSTKGREDRARGAGGVGARRVHRRVDRPARKSAAGGICVQRSSQAGRAPGGTRRRPLPHRDVLRTRRARDCDRSVHERVVTSIVALLTFDEDALVGQRRTGRFCVGGSGRRRDRGESAPGCRPR